MIQSMRTTSFRVFVLTRARAHTHARWRSMCDNTLLLEQNNRSGYPWFGQRIKRFEFSKYAPKQWMRSIASPIH